MFDSRGQVLGLTLPGALKMRSISLRTTKALTSSVWQLLQRRASQMPFMSAAQARQLHNTSATVSAWLDSTVSEQAIYNAMTSKLKRAATAYWKPARWS